jgi:hypothetical protein
VTAKGIGFPAPEQEALGQDPPAERSTLRLTATLTGQQHVRQTTLSYRIGTVRCVFGFAMGTNKP